MSVKECKRCLLREAADLDTLADIRGRLDKLAPEERSDEELYNRRLEACRECGLNKKLFMPLLDEKRALLRDALMRAAERVHDEGFEDAVKMAGKILEVSNVTS